MKKVQIIALGVASALLAGAVLAQDAVKTQPESNKVLLENDRVRVIEVTVAPGSALKTHSHPAHVIYFLGDAETRQTDAAGKVAEVAGKKGEARAVDAVTHQVDNVGKTPIHVIVVELKDAAK